MWEFSQAAGQKGDASRQKGFLHVFIYIVLALLDDPLQHESNLEADVLTSGDAEIEMGFYPHGGGVWVRVPSVQGIRSVAAWWPILAEGSFLMLIPFGDRPPYPAIGQAMVWERR